MTAKVTIFKAVFNLFPERHVTRCENLFGLQVVVLVHIYSKHDISASNIASITAILSVVLARLSQRLNVSYCDLSSFACSLLRASCDFFP